MASAPSSSFTAILRRSKFASFDPAIAQVYTTHGGDAHRGNWGLKRPLPLRRRNAAVTVSAIDSPHQQTEWKSGEPQARWVKMFGELGREATPIIGRGGEWAARIGQATHVWEIDSEFSRLEDGADAVAKDRAAQKLADAAPETSNNIPNIAAMTDRQFAAYERKLRRSQADFQSFLEENAKSNTSAADARSAHSPHSENAVKLFLQQQAAKDYSSSTRLIEQKPHPRAGLSYAHVPPMQAYFASRALPGRILGQAVSNRDHSFRGGYNAGFAGMRVFLDTKNSDGLRPARVGQEPTETRFRVESAEIGRTPRVVGRSKTALDGTAVKVNVQSWLEAPELRSNPHTPGSREWVGHQVVHTPRSSTYGRQKHTFFGGQAPLPGRMDPPKPFASVSNDDIVASLRALVQKKK